MWDLHLIGGQRYLAAIFSTVSSVWVIISWNKQRRFLNCKMQYARLPESFTKVRPCLKKFLHRVFFRASNNYLLTLIESRTMEKS